MQLSPGDYPNVKAASEVLADLLKRIGINLDYITMDWATMTQRQIKKDAPEAGGFHLHMLNVPSLSVASPLVNSRLRGVGAEESGWYTSARFEEIRGEWLRAGDAAGRRHYAEMLQIECLSSVPLAPCGVTLSRAPGGAISWACCQGVPKFGTCAGGRRRYFAFSCMRHRGTAAERFARPWPDRKSLRGGLRRQYGWQRRAKIADYPGIQG